MPATPFDHAAPHSTIRGKYQIPALTWATRVLLGLSLIALFAPRSVGRAIGGFVVGAAIAIPLLRVMWLIHRWRQERDRPFIAAGAALLTVIAVGAVVAFARS